MLFPTLPAVVAAAEVDASAFVFDTTMPGIVGWIMPAGWCWGMG